jgi:glycosyltransferase involved in cell wall biosynthesis
VSSGLLSVVVVTYEWPKALDAALAALADERDDKVEVIVADDGSGEETRSVVERWRETFGDALRHVRQDDEGWRQSRARNLGALEARGDFLAFLDGDCLARKGFVAAVRRAALPGWFLAGKRLHLGSALSERVVDEHVPVWRWSAARWVLRMPRELVTSHREAARAGVLLPVRDRRRPWRPSQPQFSPPYDAYGFFVGVSRSDFEQVNGFDMRYEGWAGEDVDLALRLRRIGLRCGWPGPKATLLHLWHSPKKGSMRSNSPLVEEATQSDRIDAVVGLRELSSELAAQETANRVTSDSSASSEPA